MNDWATRKMAIDVIYTLAAILKDVLVPFKSEILEVLNHSRFDKYKPVREATQEAYQTIKNLGREDGLEDSYEEAQKKPKHPSLRETIRQAKKGKSKKNQDTNFEILDKSNNDKKLSAATQKRLESKRAAFNSGEEEKKDFAPISYDTVKSTIKQMPKNSNFFKKQKKKKEREIEIFTSGDHKNFNYEEDMKKHREAEILQRNNAKDEDFGIEVYEGRKPGKTTTKTQNKTRYQYKREDRKVSNGAEKKQGNKKGIKDPEDIDVQIFVKEDKNKEERGSPKYVSQQVPQKVGYQTDERAEMTEEELQGYEYEHSKHLLKKHQEMMKDEGKDKNIKYEFVGVDRKREEEERQRARIRTSYVAQPPPRVATYQPQPVTTYQPVYPSQNDLLLQNKIEVFTQQMTASMANLQNFVRNEISGVKQRLTYMESKVESLVRRQNELELDRLNQKNNNSNLGSQAIIPSPPPPIVEAISASNFENKSLYNTHQPIEGSSISILEQTNDWDVALAFVQQEKLNMAYSLVLKKKDEMLLFKLMGRTGVCLDQLDPENLENVIKEIISTLKSKAFIDLLLPWVNSLARQFSKLHPVVKSTYLVKGLEDSLFLLLTDTQNYLDQLQKEDVERLYKFIKVQSDNSS